MKTRIFDPARYLGSEVAIAEYLADVCEDGSPTEIACALGDIARARGMTDIAEKTGISRQALYKALSEDGNPELATIAKVAEALGFRLAIVPAADKNEKASAA